MTKHFTLLLLIMGNFLFAYPKEGLQLVEIDPADINNPSARINSGNYRYKETDYLVIQPKTNTAAYLSEKGMDVQSYLGDGYYLVSITAAETKSRLQNLNMTRMGYLTADSKIAENLKNTTSHIPVTVLYASSADSDLLEEACRKAGMVMEHNDVKNHHFTAFANKDQIQQLAAYPFIYFVTKYYEKKSLLISDGSLMIGANQVQETAPFGYNLKGEGVNVGVWDDGAVASHIDLPPVRNIVIDKDNNSPIFMQHPTEVAGCIGGSGNVFGGLKGIAPRSTMYYWDLLNDITSEVATGKSVYNIDISNHSYNFAPTTCFESGLYIPEASDLDRLVHNNPTIVPVVAVGNSASLCTLTDTFSSVDIGYQGCKNAITVGWLFSDEKIVGNSGRGPTTDGRIKPELVAKGFAVSTTYPNNSFFTVYGSSYAAPQVAGLLALLHQKYKSQFGVLPNTSLMKAILCNTARDLGNPGPDYTFGFGKPDAYKAVYAVENSLFFEDNITQNSVKVHSVSVPDNLMQLKVTLCWTDKEGSPIASKAIVNNLDLKLVTPSGDTILPWKLNPSVYKNNAIRGVDNLNTIEQVTINNPIAGNYTIVVKGTGIPYGPQAYALAYLNQERKIEITFPNGGEVLDATDEAKIRWYGNGIDSLCNIDFSSDNGASWTTIAANYQLSKRTCPWTVPQVNSDKCFIRISSGNNITLSDAPFTIGSQVFYPSINHTVCDRSVKINWPPYTGATAYKVYLFADNIWVYAGQTNSTTFTINNLINGKTYFYSISVIKNGLEGNHSLSNSFTPKSTVCTTLNDVGVYAVHKPNGGRKFTSSALSVNEKLSFIIKNFGTATQNSVSISYRLNNGPVRNAVLSEVMTSNDTAIVYFSVNENLSAAGNYSVVAWTNLPGDANTGNDTLAYVIRHLNNNPLVLPVTESFEATDTTLSGSAFAINGMDYVDYYPEDGGRLRTNEGNLYARTGSRAVTLDNYIGGAAKKNELIFTYNLSNYTDSIIFLDFNYMHRSEPDGNDEIYARGDDTKPWVLIFDLYAKRNGAGKYKAVKELNLYQKLKIENAQGFSSSTQIMIRQTGTKAGLSPYNDGGYTFDDFKLYVAGKDASVVNASIKKTNCTGSFTALPLTIKILNNSSQTIVNLPVSYKVADNPVVNEIIPVAINANDTASYTFSTLFNYSTPGLYNIKTWVSNVGDNYKMNDSFNTATVIVMNTINEFPYYNDLESDNGGLFSEGVNNSWVWATPAKFNINNAAQGNKAWTTGVSRGYSFNENSYLYMGCMDFSSLTTDPLISFNFLSVLQTQSDSAYAEYSTNGVNWQRLGCYNCGLNWYNGYQNKPYWDRVIFPWQTAHVKVILDSLADKSNFMYRIRMLSNNFYVTEGLGIDDIHILKDYEDMAVADSAYVSQVSSGNGWISFYRNGRLVADLYDDNKVLGNVTLGFEANTNKEKQFNNLTIFPRNWVIKAQNSVAGNFKLRLYVLNEEYTGFVINEDSINRMGDIGLLRYTGLNTNLDVVDNHVKSYYKYYSPEDIQFYPYLNGYYVEFMTDTLGEFYLISTKQDADAILDVNVVDFRANIINDDVYLEWKTTKEIDSKEFIVQYSFDASTFIDIDTVPAGGFSSNTTLYNYLHQLNATTGVYYYRIKIIDNSNKTYFSLIDSVYFAPVVGIKQNTLTMNAYISGNDIVVDFKNKMTTSTVVYVYNTAGQLQHTKRTDLSNGINPLGVRDFIHWPNGAYFLQVQTKEQNYYSKLVKQ